MEETVIDIAIYPDPRIKKGETLSFDASNRVWLCHPSSVEALRERIAQIGIPERKFSRQEFRSVSKKANKILTNIAGALPENLAKNELDLG
jgi:hypothetical protein